MISIGIAQNCSKNAMKGRNMSEMSLFTTIGLESNPFMLFTPETRFGKVGWSLSSKSGSQDGVLVENDDEHYEIIGQMNSTEIFIHWSSNPYYNTKNEYKEFPQPSSHQGLSYPSYPSSGPCTCFYFW